MSDEFDLDDLFDTGEAVVDRKTRVSGESAVMLVDNGPSQEIEDLPAGLDDPLDVEENPFLEYVTDQDNFGSFAPAIDAAVEFERDNPAEMAEASRGGNDEDEEDGEDEFDENARMHAEESVGHDGTPVSDLLRMVNVRQRQTAQIAELAPWRRINPPSAERGLMGGLLLTPPVVPGQAVDTSKLEQVINWVGDDIEALPVTITVSPTGIETLFDNIVRPYARIEWGTRAGRHSVDIDIGLGQQLTIAASSVYVSLGFLGSLIHIPGARYGLHASYGFYTCVRTTPLAFTSYTSAAAAGDTGAIARPHFATQISGISRTQPSCALTVLLLDNNGSTIDVISIAAGARLESPIYLPNDCVNVVIQNGGGVTTTMRIIWGLSL